MALSLGGSSSARPTVWMPAAELEAYKRANQSGAPSFVRSYTDPSQVPQGALMADNIAQLSQHRAEGNPLLQGVLSGIQAPQQALRTNTGAPVQNTGAAGGGGGAGGGAGTGLYGLSGAENALTGALRGATGDLKLGATIGRNDVIGARDGALNTLGAGTDAAANALQTSTNTATGRLDPYANSGGKANDLAAALSGALGGEAQAEAFANYNESPGQAYLREQSEKAITRNAAATGGLQGGNVLKALQKNAAGLASQEFDKSYGRLANMGQQGMAASGLQAGLDADLGKGVASLRSNEGRDKANIMTSSGNKLSDIATTGGQASANARLGIGGQQAGIRYDAGNQISDKISNTASGMASEQSQSGLNLANLLGGNSEQVAQLLANLGTMDASSMEQLSTLLANLNIGQANLGTGQSSVASLMPGQSNFPELMTAIGSIMSQQG